MPNFLQRAGLAPLTKVIQTNSIDHETRNLIWSIFHRYIWDSWAPTSEWSGRSKEAQLVDLIEATLWTFHFHLPRDEYNIGRRELQNRVKTKILNDEWHGFFHLTESIVNAINDERVKNNLIGLINKAFEKHNVGYRFAMDILTPVVSPISIEAIEKAHETSSREVKIHLEAALKHLSAKDHPDYRNSIKESISAVEASLSFVTGKKGVDLSRHLVEFKKHNKIHPQFEQALLKLWAYTNNEGIRHGLTEDTEEVAQADAQFMLVSASAFIDYLFSSLVKNNQLNNHQRL